MIETFRAIGYNIENSLFADIIDNSISANAKNIWINFKMERFKTWLAIKDDGIGMNDAELIQAMRPDVKSTSERNQKRLRFWIRFKTASFSQSKKTNCYKQKVDYNSVFGLGI